MITKSRSFVFVRIMFISMLVAGSFGVQPVQASKDTRIDISTASSSIIGDWNALGNNGLDGAVTAVVFVGDDMYVGGGFTKTGDGTVTGLNNIAKYNMVTKTWSALPNNGLNSAVNTMIVNGDDIYVGGTFTQTLDGVVTNLNLIAKFDTATNTWSSLPRGGLFGGVVYTMVINGDYLYAGGWIIGTADNAIQAYHIIRLNLITNIWSALPHVGLNDTARVISFKGNDMYVGGDFRETYDGVVTGLNGIAKFDMVTNIWSALSHNGFNWGPVDAIAFNGNDMYVGGAFTQTFDGAITNLNHIARYDISTDTWYGFPHNGLNGSNNYVGALTILDDKLFIGGSFSQTFDGVITNLYYVAKYDLKTGVWSAMPHNGLNNVVTTIVPYRGDIFSGGYFTKTHDLSLDLNRIAVYGVCVLGPITVENLNDSGVGSLRQAIMDVCSGDTINFNVSGTIVINSSLPDINKTLTIDGSGQVVVLDGANNYRSFKVTSVGNLTIKNLTLQNGNAVSCDININLDDCGGAVYNNGIVTITNSTFSGNTSSQLGGALFIDSGIANISNSTFLNNSATYGGGAYIWIGSMNAVNSTFYGNSASDSGGGLYNAAGTLTMVNSTIANNSGVYGGGLYNSGKLDYTNTILANSISGSDCYQDNFAAEILTNTNNIVMTNATSPNNCDILAFTSDPLLGPLQDNDGFTQTMALGAGSSAIDAGDTANCPDTDQRGVTRPQGSHCDIGAYEYEPVPAKIDVTIGGDSQGNYTLGNGEERRLSFNVSGGPVKVESSDPSKKIVTAIRLQSYVNNTLYSFAETMGVPSGLLSYKYYFPSYNNIWAPLNSQIRFSNLDANPTTIRVTIGGDNVWEQQVLGGEEKRLSFDVSGEPVIIESLDPAKKIAAAIRLQSYANNTLYSFAETMGIPAEQVSNTYYFPSYNNIWAPLNSQLRIGNLDASDVTVRVTIGGDIVWEDVVPGLDEKRLSFNVSGGPVKVESLDPDPSKKIVTAIRLQSYANNTLYSFAETMGVPSGLLSYKYYFPSYNNIWAPLNSQIRFSNLDANPTTIRVTIGGNNVWEQQVLGGEEKRLSFDVSGGPVIIESLDPAKKIAAAIRLQSYANNTLYSFAETMGIPAEWMSNTYYFPSYNNIWAPLNSQLRFGLP